MADPAIKAFTETLLNMVVSFTAEKISLVRGLKKDQSWICVSDDFNGSLFQDAQKDVSNNIATCKMHDIVHDFALQVSEKYCYHVKDWRSINSKIEAVHTLRAGRLREASKGFWNFSTLRQIHLIEFSDLPRFSQLSNLRTVVLAECEGSQIQELEHFDNLKGELKLYSLELVKSDESAIKSNLSKKSGVQSLKLYWVKERLNIWNESKEDYIDERLELAMMKAFEPHPNLKDLTMNGIPIRKHPSWMKRENDHMPSILDNLVRLELSHLHNCERLPALGDLPRLEYLKIEMYHG
ncbi:OLC1v1019480C1 [Oldenlandia corymbosa var. corymbosa]|uniref:OLC1v1019480C1 n=1 Tax=Oldenlandia corymbosa var. corymbosa TaxID=529605 RepID=A0AAV1EEH8_OLDCO|nr:OLC1v1019480C1 [Oldenlandia corymbosa var. corymbosa]